MTASRSRKQSKAYDYHLKYIEPPTQGCAFCKIDENSYQFIGQSTFFKIIRNIFPYSLWDGQEVVDHLMLLPKKHTDSLSQLPDGAAVEFVSLISGYESKGYSVYARAPGSLMKSLAHQHTHLIKAQKNRIRALLYIRRPYIRLLKK